jgi:mitofilin
MIPPGNDGLVGYALGNVFEKITFAPDGATATGDDADSILARADYALDRGDLKKSVGELEKLKGKAGFIVKDFLEEAKARLTTQELLKIIMTEASVKNSELIN